MLPRMQAIRLVEHWIDMAALIGLAALAVFALLRALDWVARGAGTTRTKALGVTLLLAWLFGR